MFTIYQPASPKHQSHGCLEGDMNDAAIVTKLQHYFYIDIAPPGYDWGKSASPPGLSSKKAAEFRLGILT